MKLARAASHRPRADAQAFAYAAAVSVGVVCSVVAWATGLTDGSSVVRAVGLALLAGAAAWVLWAGQISRVSVHPLTIATLLGTFVLDLSVKDDLLRTLAAAWILLILVMMSSALSRRAVAWYAVACTAAGLVVEATVPGPPALFAMRLVAIGGLIALPLVYVVKARGELERALATARDVAVYDSLTGLLNRRGLHERFPDLARGCARRGDTLAVVVLDLDHFKRINDTMGHAAGDDVLVTVGRSLNAAARAGDLVVRLGGEEIALLGAVADAQEALALAERLRRQVRQDGTAWSLTISAGVALVFDIGSSETPEELQTLLGRLMADADGCLYQAKSDGRDRVVGPSATVRPARVRLGGSRRAEDLSHPHP